MTQLFEAMEKFFSEDEWPFSHVEGQTAISSGFRGDNGGWNCYASVREEMGLFLFYSVCPVNVPEEKRPVMAEFLTRVNYGLNMTFRTAKFATRPALTSRTTA